MKARIAQTEKIVLKHDILIREQEDGFYKVVGRIKEIIIPAGGENIAPTNIEDEIRIALADVVSNVMVTGDGKQYLTCLLTLKVR